MRYEENKLGGPPGLIEVLVSYRDLVGGTYQGVRQYSSPPDIGKPVRLRGR